MLIAAYFTSITEDGVAKGEDALTILDNPKTRALFLDDLLEVIKIFNSKMLLIIVN